MFVRLRRADGGIAQIFKMGNNRTSGSVWPSLESSLSKAKKKVAFHSLKLGFNLPNGSSRKNIFRHKQNNFDKRNMGLTFLLSSFLVNSYNMHNL